MPKYVLKRKLIGYMIHGINYFFIICLGEAIIIELKNSTLCLQFISGSNH